MFSPLKIIVIEDEPLICVAVETALKKVGYRIIGDADNFEDGLSIIKNKTPDLVLVDIQLEGEKDGIDLVFELDKLKIPYLFLTSQTDPETIERVKQTKPLGYIVKPFTESGLQSNIDLAWHNYSKEHNSTILIKDSGRLIKVNQNDIAYLKAFDNYCYIVTENKEYLLPHTLKHTVQKLDEGIFIKTHRSYVVNINHIKSIHRKTLEVMGTSIPLSSSNRHLVIEKMNSI